MRWPGRGLLTTNRLGTHHNQSAGKMGVVILILMSAMLIRIIVMLGTECLMAVMIMALILILSITFLLFLINRQGDSDLFRLRSLTWIFSLSFLSLILNLDLGQIWPTLRDHQPTYLCHSPSTPIMIIIMMLVTEYG